MMHNILSDEFVPCLLGYTISYNLLKHFVQSLLLSWLHPLQLLAELEKLVEPVDREQFTGLPSSLEKRQVEFGERKGKVDELATQCYDHTSSLMRQLEGVMRSSRDAGHPVSYTNSIRVGDLLSL